MSTHRTRRTMSALTITLAIGLGLSACGSDDGTDDGTDTQVSATEHNDADVDFASDMIQHHAQALSMVDLTIDRDLDPEVQQLAEDIRAAQGPEVETLSDWLADWGEDVPETMRDHVNAGHDSDDGSGDMEGMEESDADMPGMMSADDLQALEDAPDADFQTMWLDMMIEHHEGAVEMSETEVEDGQYKPAVDLADSIISSQTEQVGTMQRLLDSSAPTMGGRAAGALETRPRTASRSTARSPPSGVVDDGLQPQILPRWAHPAHADGRWSWFFSGSNVTMGSRRRCRAALSCSPTRGCRVSESDAPEGATPDVGDPTEGKPKRRGRVKKKHTVGKVLLVTVASCSRWSPACATLYLYRHLNGNLNVIDVADQLANRPEKKKVEGPKEPLNVLVMGSDTRDGAGNNIDNLTGGGERSDTTILLHLSADRKRAYGISIPRDSLVDRPDCNDQGRRHRSPAAPT